MADKQGKKGRRTAKSGSKPGGRLARLWSASLKSGRLVALIMLVVFISLRLADPAPLQIVRKQTFDLYQRLKPREITARPVTIVDLDEKSLAEVGQWPWPRTLVADLIDRLFAMGAIVVGFDMVFAEPDRMTPDSLAEVLPGLDPEMRDKLRGLPGTDEVFARAIANGRVVMGQSVRNDAPPQAEDAPTTSVAWVGGVDPLPYLEPHGGLVRNIPLLDHQAMGRGVFNVSPELDGIIRRVPMVLNVEDQIHPSLSTEMLRVATGNTTILVKTPKKGQGVEGVYIKPKLIKTDEAGRVWVYFSRYDTAKYLPAVDVLNGTAPPEMVRNKLVIIGTSAVGLLDIKSSPVNSFLPGVEVHTNIIENVLSDTQLRRPGYMLGSEMTIALVLGLLLMIVVPLAPAVWTLGTFIVVAGGLVGTSWYLFAQHLLLFDPVMPFSSSLLIYGFLTYASFSREEAQRRQVREAFSRYMSPALVERLADDPGQLKLGGEMRDMTLLFCDVRGFTTISEQFDAEGLTRLINRFLTPMTNKILEHRGTIDKYMGDCIMAFWNAPLDDAEHARNGCNAAIEMKGLLVGLNQDLKAEAEAEGRRHIPLNIGIGINSGICCVGNMGSDQRFDYSVLGDNVNLASRLEGQSKTYGVTTVLGENTRALVPDYATLELDRIRVKGKTLPVTIFGLLGNPEVARSEEFQTLAAHHGEMIAAYRAQDWDTAGAALDKARAAAEPWHIDGLYALYAARLEDYRLNSPGADWDGVYVALTK
ncbi:CHASE2 domain-containing protein [Roseospirillum parvum]|uniref:Adenylate cyclase n=1 Tax=Roseospirillum parvum TaxID=83401 RepID=A0A1G7YF32_9PROT|nr:adenylate/guanylate cyclase domain-containing protein [Roseospirillum parvum]SDG94926.1 adenylate cyclase [Roseospirillum parvum]